MKWSTILSASALTAAALASPIASSGGGSSGGGFVETFVLRVSSDDKHVDGKYISAARGNLGISSADTADSAIRVSTDKADEGSDKIRLHPYPVVDNDHSLGLVGENGFLDFLDLPQSAEGEDEGGHSFAEFVVGDNHELIWGRRDKVVAPGWIASPDGDDYSIKYFDNEGGSLVTQDYIPITILLEVEGL